MENITKGKIGYLIHANLDDSKKSQRDIAKELGVSQSAVSTWCSGTVVPPTDKFLRICEILKLTPNEFLQMEGTERNPVVVEKIVYKDAPAERTEWLKDDEGIWFCKKCRMDAPYDRTGYQHRSKCCPYCGRLARPEKPTVALDGKEKK